MNSAMGIFEQLSSFKQMSDTGISSQQQLERYCVDVLGSVERFHVDFKEKSARNDSKLAQSDKRNLAKAVSGFANSGGGILIWGIEDKAMRPKPINEIENFLQNLLELAPLTTDPVVQGIDGDWIPSDGEGGFGIVFIPESSLPPHGVILSDAKLKNHYYVRSGNSFVAASHPQLEDMFGRRPRPKLELSTRFVFHNRQEKVKEVVVFVGIENKGRGTAKAPFLAAKVHSPHEINRFGIDGNGNFGLVPMAKSLDSRERMFGASPDIALHPSMIRDVLRIVISIDVTKAPQLTADLVIDYRIAAEGIQLIEGQKIVQKHELWDVINNQV